MLCFVGSDLSVKMILKTSIKPIIASVCMIGICLPMSLYLQPSIINTFLLVFIGMIMYALVIILLKDDLVLSLFKRLFKKKSDENTTK